MDKLFLDRLKNAEYDDLDVCKCVNEIERLTEELNKYSCKNSELESVILMLKIVLKESLFTHKSYWNFCVANGSDYTLGKDIIKVISYVIGENYAGK